MNYEQLTNDIYTKNNAFLYDDLIYDNDYKTYCLNHNYKDLFLQFVINTSDDKMSVNKVLNLYKNYFDSTKYENIKNKLNILYSKNDEIFDTMIGSFMVKCIDKISIKNILTISLYRELQEELSKLNDNELSLINRIFDIANLSKYDTCSLIYNVIKNFKNYKNILNNSSNINDDELINFIYILQNFNNNFNIENINDLSKDNFNNKLLSLYNNFDYSNSNEYEIKNMIFFKKYGFNYLKAFFIVKRYCYDTDILLSSNLDKISKDFIIDIYNILTENDINKLKQIYIESPIVYPNFNDVILFEEHIRSKYALMYNKVLYKTCNNNFNSINDYLTYLKLKNKFGTKNVYLLKDDFNLIIHALGAYSGYKRPDNFNDDWNRPKVASHGICTSFIANNQIAPARFWHPILGFDNIKENELLLSANFDIGSLRKNTMFSTSSQVFARFLPPDEMINNTRNFHNEMVLERMNYNNDSVNKKKPSYLIFLVDDINNEYNFKTRKELLPVLEKRFIRKELLDDYMKNGDPACIDYALNEKEIFYETADIMKKAIYYEETCKALKNMNLPVLVIDRLYYCNREKEKCNLYFSMFQKTYNDEYLKKLLLTYFNNTVGCFDFSKTNQEYTKYFNDENIEIIINEMIKVIDNIENRDIKLKCINTLKEEIDKENIKRNIVDTKKRLPSLERYLNYIDNVILKYQDEKIK